MYIYCAEELLYECIIVSSLVCILLGLQKKKKQIDNAHVHEVCRQCGVHPFLLGGARV